MIKAWRIVKSRYKTSAFSGQGSAYASGRWHELKVPVVYSSDSPALAALEQFVHLQDEGKQIKFVLFEIQIPLSLIIKVEDITSLPKSWKKQPPHPTTKKIGSQWYKSANSAVLSVPAVLVPNSRNFLLNPHHPNFKKIKILPSTPFSFDPRLWK